VNKINPRQKIDQDTENRLIKLSYANRGV